MKEEKSINAQELDKHMHIQDHVDDGLKWYSPKDAPFQIVGFPWFSKDRVYRRLPISHQEKIPEPVDLLANCTAGGQIRFVTDSTKLSIRVRLSGIANMYHMPATGQCSFDCYIGMPGEQIYYSTAGFDHTKLEYESVLYSGFTNEIRMVTLNFPLYQGVEEVSIGIEHTATILPPPAFDEENKIIIYGTSITQGGCASRPGMAYTNIISRRINREFINLGFSGNGKGEPELARIIREIQSPACVVLDYEANCVSTELFQRTLPEFIRIYRESHSEVPILVISRIPYGKERFQPQLAKTRLERKELQIQIVESFRKQGDKHIYFCDGSHLLGEHYQEATVDGSHPTDLGFISIADRLTPVLQEILMR